MLVPKEHPREQARLTDLLSYDILDTLSEKEYDDLTAIASEICNTPICLVSLVDKDRQWFKSKHGLGAPETPRDHAFCAHAIHEPHEIFMVEDAREDDRFHDNPLVTGDPHVIFYAGVPLISEAGLPLGTLCVIDHKPRVLSEKQINSLKALSEQVMNVLKLRRKNKQLHEKNEDLKRFAYMAAHDIKSPLNNINGLLGLFKDVHGKEVSDEGNELIDMVQGSSDKLKRLIDGLLQFSTSDKMAKENIASFPFAELQESIEQLLNPNKAHQLNWHVSLPHINTSKTALTQILVNLISNAIKYNDKELTVVDIFLQDNTHCYSFIVQDNGPGIPEEHKAKAFNIFEVLQAQDRFGEAGTGIGLATVKKLIESLGGGIRLDSAPGEGATFSFSIEKS